MADVEGIWRRKSDEELLTAVSSLDDFTDEARRVITAEAVRRGFAVASITQATAAMRRQEPAGSGSCAYCGTHVLFGGKREGALRFCNEECRGAGVMLSISHQVPDSLVGEEVRTVHSSSCPACDGPGPVDVHTSHRIWSAVFLSYWFNTPRVSCKSCGNRAKLRDAAVSLALGWWSLPWGVVMTPVQVGRNVAGLLRGSGDAGPSKKLESLVRLRLAEKMLRHPKGEG